MVYVCLREASNAAATRAGPAYDDPFAVNISDNNSSGELNTVLKPCNGETSFIACRYRRKRK